MRSEKEDLRLVAVLAVAAAVFLGGYVYVVFAIILHRCLTGVVLF